MSKKYENIVIFSLSNNKKLSKKVCEDLKILESKVKVEKFADGEVLVKAGNSVRGKDAYIIQSTSKPANHSIMELLIFIDSLKRASARSITAIIPYFGYARQDRKAAGRQPITAKLVADLITVAGATKVITFDLHSPQIQGFFNIPTDNLKGLAVIQEEIKNMKLSDIVVASPDYGGIARARSLAEKLGKDIPIATIDKIRYGKNKTKINGVFGDVNGKNVVVVDDIIDTGGTILKAAEMFKKRGTKNVIIACTHPVFSNDTSQKLADSEFIDKILVTDTIELTKEQLHRKITVISLYKFIADVIRANVEHTSITSVYRLYDK